MTNRRAFTIAMLLLAVGALAFRLPSLGNRPFHGDEAVHAFKFLDLWKHGVYRYDPNEFHGPTIYYAALPSIWLHGRHTFEACTESDFRLPIALFGAAMILAVAPLASGLGKRAILCSALLIAISPALVFYSRYYIQETLLAFFTLAMLACCWQYTRSARKTWLLLAGACAGLMIASKETAVLSFAAMAGALMLTRFWNGRAGDLPRERSAAWQPGAIAASVAVALVVALLFVSGFGSNHSGPAGLLTGPIDYLKSFTPWLRRAGGASFHVYPWNYYLGILLWTRHGTGPVYSEGLIVALALAGTLSAVFPLASLRAKSEQQPGKAQAGPVDHRPDPVLLRFLICYTVLLTALYSAIPYKTPWCAINFLSGMVLLAGVGTVWLFRAARVAPARVVLALILAGAVAQLAAQSYRASYQAFTDPANPYVYSQPVPDVVKMEAWVKDVAHYGGMQPDSIVKVIWTDDYHWPIAWYLREFQNVQQLEGFYHDAGDPQAPLVLASPEFEDALTMKLDKTHVMARFFGIRPGVFAQVWVRMDVWERYLKNRPRPKDED